MLDLQALGGPQQKEGCMRGPRGSKPGDPTVCRRPLLWPPCPTKPPNRPSFKWRLLPGRAWGAAAARLRGCPTFNPKPRLANHGASVQKTNKMHEGGCLDSDNQQARKCSWEITTLPWPQQAKTKGNKPPLMVPRMQKQTMFTLTFSNASRNHC